MGTRQVPTRASRRIARVAVLCLLISTLHGPQALASDPIGPGSIIFGVHPDPATQAEVETYEQRIGRQFAAARIFLRWDAPFPTATDLWLRDTGHAHFLSVATRTLSGAPVTWRSVADAIPGSPVHDMLLSWAQRIRDFQAPLYFLFSHEPMVERNSDMGTNVDFIDAWRKVYTLFHAEGVTNATFVWTMTDESFWITGPKAAANWYPGDAFVDAIGADAYNWYNCKPAFPNGAWKSFFSIVNPLRLFGQQHPTKPLMLPEFATVEDPAVPGRKAQWLLEATELLASPGWEMFDAVLYFNRTDFFNPGCAFRVDSSLSSLAAYAAMGAHPHFAGVARPPPPPPTADTTPPTVPGTPSGSSPVAGQITISWTASSDASPPITYRIYRDGGTNPIGQTQTTTFTDLGLTGGTTHTYEIDAVDSAFPASNTSAKSPASDPILVQAGAPPIFTDDFTSGGFTNWTAMTRLTIDNATGTPAAPSARAQVNGQSAFATRTLTGTFNQVCMSVAVNVTNGGGNAIDLLRLRSAANGPISKVYLSGSGILYFRNDVGGNQQSSNVALGTGWHEVELCGTVGTNTTWDLYRDGVRIINGVSANTGTTPVGLIQIGDTANRTMTVNFDRVLLDQVPGEGPPPTADTTPPTVPGTPSGSSPVAGQITISWTASSDASPPITYRIYRDGGTNPIGQTQTTTFTDLGLTGGTTHTYEIDAVDSAFPASNTSAKSPASDPILVQAGAPPIFTDDFTSGGFTNWTAMTRLTIDNATGTPAAPSARAQVNGQSAFATRTLTGTFNQVCMSVAVNVTNGGGNAIDLLRLRSAANGPISKVYLSASGTLYFRADVGGTQTSSGVALGSGWHEIELCGTVGTNTTWDLYRDGVRIINGVSANTGTTPVGLIQIGDTANRTMTVNYDNVRVDQTPGE